MSNFQLNTSVAFIIFKRPDTTAKVFEAIRQAKPPKLFVIADAPRPEISGEIEKCNATRAIIDSVDWNCEVFKNYSDKNMGCDLRVTTGISWVFDHVDETIILEDDCLPDPSFFLFCEQLLKYYRHDERIMHISGNNFQFGRKRTNYSYYFSRYPHIWGWATWKRAWKLYDFEMKSWQDSQEQNILKTILQEPDALEYWSKIFQSVLNKELNTVWDYQWTFTCWIQNGLSVLPNVNLVSNIGFSNEGTNTINKQKNYAKKFANLPTESINFPVQHPKFMVRDSEADSFTQQEMFMLNLSQRINLKIKSLIDI
jgi:hypothetical protein